jgi:NTP pyrophosphatase (non-canonical NTP hydrolase)
MIKENIAKLILAKRASLILILGKAGHGKTTAYRQILTLLSNQKSEHPVKIVSIEPRLESWWRTPLISSDPPNLVQFDTSGINGGVESAMKYCLKLRPNVIGIDGLNAADAAALKLIGEVSFWGQLVVATIQENGSDVIEAFMQDLSPLVLYVHNLGDQNSFDLTPMTLDVFKKLRDVSDATVQAMLTNCTFKIPLNNTFSPNFGKIDKQNQTSITFSPKGDIQLSINNLVNVCHAAAKGWWNDLHTGEPIIDRPHVIGEKLMLIVSEIAEAMEGHRKNLMDDKLPHRKMIEVELADAMIRICDLAGAMGMNLGGAVSEKLAYNSNREDHKLEARKAEGGKLY